MSIFNDIYQKIIKGEVICLPTDTVWGFICKATSDKAIQRIYSLKNRNSSKPIALIANNLAMAERYLILNDQARKLLNHETSITIIAPAKLPLRLSRFINLKNQTLALRISKNPMLLDLINKLDEPIAATSANLSGKETNLATLYKLYNQKLAIYNLPENSRGEPSAIIDFSTSKPKLIRASSDQQKSLQIFL